jgi:hypothetical protein
MPPGESLPNAKAALASITDKPPGRIRRERDPGLFFR